MKRHTTNRALVALQEQVSLLNWWETNNGVGFSNSWRDYNHFRRLNPAMPDLGDMENYKLDRARTYWVTSDMQALMAYAAEKMEPQPIVLDDLPSRSGFVWFEDLVEQIDARGLPITWRALAWTVLDEVTLTDGGVGPGVHLTYYTDLEHVAEGEFPVEYVMSHGPVVNAERNRRIWLNQGNPRLMLLHDPGEVGEN